MWMELGGGDDLCKFLHIDRFDVYDVWRDKVSGRATATADRGRTEALVADTEIPQVDAEIVCRNVGLLIRIDGDGVDVVCMGIGVNLARDGGNDIVLLYHAGKFEM